MTMYNTEYQGDDYDEADAETHPAPIICPFCGGGSHPDEALAEGWCSPECRHDWYAMKDADSHK